MSHDIPRNQRVSRTTRINEMYGNPGELRSAAQQSGVDLSISHKVRTEERKILGIFRIRRQVDLGNYATITGTQEQIEAFDRLDPIEKRSRRSLAPWFYD